MKKDSQIRLDIITGTLGHETGHALYAQNAEKERHAASYAITEGIRAAGQNGQFDATSLVNGYIRSSRRDEAQAEIHGWNAPASRIEYVKGTSPSREEVISRAEASTGCMDRDRKDVPRLATGIVLDADMHMSDTRLPKAGPINLEPVAQRHFDQSRASLGKGGGAKYPNYYGAYLVQQLAGDTSGWVRLPTVKLDMGKLGLDKTQLESTVLRLSSEGLSVLDIGQGRYKPIVLHSSGSGIQGTPDADQSVAQRVDAPLLLSKTTHPAQALTQQGSFPKPQFDAVVMNNDGAKVIGVYGPLDSPANRLAAADIQQALSVALIEQSSDVARTAMHSLQEQQALTQVQTETIGVDVPTASGPVMKIGARTMTPASGPSGESGSDGGGSGDG